MRKFPIGVSAWFVVATVMVVSLVEGAYPTDPTADISWSCGYSGVSDIECAFNNARSVENTQLGTSLPMLTLPSQASWDAMSDGEKVLWLTNRERIDRGVDPLTDVEANVTGVAETYANYLLANNVFSHDADGRTPWERLADNPAIGVCHDFLSVAENLAAFFSSGGGIAIPVERSVYMWMYQDAGSAWGHRHIILWYPYNDNSGSARMEGFLGIGRASGGPYLDWPFAEIIVMNVFDPCATWESDWDGDGIPNDEDNCPNAPNGPLLGTCVKKSGTDAYPVYIGLGVQCTADTQCASLGGTCELSQADTYPSPGGNGCGDACECYADIIGPQPGSPPDGKVNLSDLTQLKIEYNRTNCATIPCQADMNGDNKVNLNDLTIMKLQYNRTGCPSCS